MKIPANTLRDARKRSMLLAIPPVVFCFATLLFWTLGGGRVRPVSASANSGLIMRLPSGILAAEQTGDKLSFYDRARADSLKKEQQRKADPYTLKDTTGRQNLPGTHAENADSPDTPPLGVWDQNHPADVAAVNEMRINRRLAALQEVISKPPKQSEAVYYKGQPGSPADAAPVTKLATEDPELRQMNGLLEKILEIQHPERSELRASKPAPASVKKFRAIPALIDGTQKIVQGTVVRLKLADTVTLAGQFYQKGQLLYGSGILSNQRYILNIKSIHVGYNFYPVDLTVFDMTDGLEGISVPEAITEDALRGGAVNGVQNLEMMSVDPSLTAQLATTGINTAKGLFNKKVKSLKGKLKNGHALLLRDNEEVLAVNKKGK